MSAPATPAIPVFPLHQLAAAFVARSAVYENYAVAAVTAWREAAQWLEASLAAHLDAVLSVSAAAAEAGWSYEGLRRRVIGDATINAGTPGSPAIRRRDLQGLGAGRGPRSAGDASPPPDADGPRPREGNAADGETPPPLHQRDRVTPRSGVPDRSTTNPSPLAARGARRPAANPRTDAHFRTKVLARALDQ